MNTNRVIGPYGVDHPEGEQVIMFWWREHIGFDMDYYDRTEPRDNTLGTWHMDSLVPRAWQPTGAQND